jgi:hypothetical protein
MRLTEAGPRLGWKGQTGGASGKFAKRRRLEGHRSSFRRCYHGLGTTLRPKTRIVLCHRNGRSKEPCHRRHPDALRRYPQLLAVSRNDASIVGCDQTVRAIPSDDSAVPDRTHFEINVCCPSRMKRRLFRVCQVKCGGVKPFDQKDMHIGHRSGDFRILNPTLHQKQQSANRDLPDRDRVCLSTAAV